jgi:hypothetical protein
MKDFILKSFRRGKEIVSSFVESILRLTRGCKCNCKSQDKE